MEVNILDLKGNKLKDVVTLSDEIWSLKANKDLIAQVYNVYMSNQRKGTAAAKTRAQVSGGGRKPWKQKGTGRARSGSIRSPIWKGGGVAFTPTDTNWDRKINKKMRRKAVAMMLSQLLKGEALSFMKFGEKDAFKDMRAMIGNMAKNNESFLLVSGNGNASLGVRNMKNVTCTKPEVVNVYDLLKAKVIIVDSEAVSVIEKNLLTNEK